MMPLNLRQSEYKLSINDENDLIFDMFYRRYDVELRPLTELKDIEKANAAWPHHTSSSIKYLQRLVKHHANVGAFKPDGTMVAWILR